MIVQSAAIWLAVAGAASAADGGSLKLGAHYYPWYYKERWTSEPVCNTPTLGFYSSDDRKVAAKHVEWAKRAGIDFFLISWLSAEGREGRNFTQTVLPELERAKFQFAIHYETPLALELPAGQPLDFEARTPTGEKAGERFVKHFEYMSEQLFTRPTYLKHNGKAVVVIYLVRDMVNADPWLTQARANAKSRGVELFLIADAVYWQPADKMDWPLLKRRFQAVTAYNMYYRPKYLEAVRTQFTAADRVAQSHGLGLIPSVKPGYDDTPLRGEGRPTLHRRQGNFYRDSWKVAAPFVSSRQPFLFVTSFNEWHEGTELEPSLEFGEKYLNLTKELAADLRQSLDQPKRGATNPVK